MAAGIPIAFSAGGAGARGGAGGAADFQFPFDPSMYLDLIGQARGAVPTAVPQVTDYLSQAMQSPLLMQILEPMLARLMGGEQQQQQQLTDVFRAAGGMRGGAYGQAMPRLMGEQAQARGNLISDVLAKTLAPILQALNQQTEASFMPARAYSDILGRLPGPVYKEPRARDIDRDFGTPSSAFGSMSSGGGRLAGTGMSDAERLFRLQKLYEYAPGYGGAGGGGAGASPYDYLSNLSLSGGGGYGVAQNPYTGVWESNPFPASYEQAYYPPLDESDLLF